MPFNSLSEVGILTFKSLCFYSVEFFRNQPSRTYNRFEDDVLPAPRKVLICIPQIRWKSLDTVGSDKGLVSASCIAMICKSSLWRDVFPVEERSLSEDDGRSVGPSDENWWHLHLIFIWLIVAFSYSNLLVFCTFFCVVRFAGHQFVFCTWFVYKTLEKKTFRKKKRERKNEKLGPFQNWLV